MDLVSGVVGGIVKGAAAVSEHKDREKDLKKLKRGSHNIERERHEAVMQRESLELEIKRMEQRKISLEVEMKEQKERKKVSKKENLDRENRISMEEGKHRLSMEKKMDELELRKKSLSLENKSKKPELLKNQKINDYTIIRELGAGSFGVTKLARKKDTGQKCVLKIINKSMGNSNKDMLAENEVKVMKSLQHPYIIQYLDSFVDKGQQYIVMSYCSGGDLQQLIQDQMGLHFQEGEILDMFCQMCLGLKYLHGRKILHRDLKPANVFIDDKGKIKLGDFGVARNLEHTLALASTVCGSFLYMSPEILGETPYNEKSDLWALGCIIYEMVSLKCAFTNVVQITKCAYTPLSPGKYSQELIHLVEEILQ